MSPMFQLELIDLECKTELKNKFTSASLMEFYCFVPDDKYPEVVRNAQRMISIFGSTYLCEQYFSRMKHIKSHLTSKLTQTHLTSASRIATTSLKLDIKKVMLKKSVSVFLLA